MNKRAETKIAELVAKRDAQLAELLREAMQWAYTDAGTQAVVKLKQQGSDGAVLAVVLSSMKGE